jgi:BirA family biotin operon repressor/biotin-[acetyl-CoA-carboxylase] ligase
MTVDSRSSIPFPSPNAFHERLATLLPEFDAVDWVKSTGSTNKDLGDFARAMASSAALRADVPVSTVAAASWPRLLGAHLQTAGKGRAARPWHNAAGECLMFSCGFTSKIGMGELPGVAPALGIASCLALRSVLAPLLGARAAHQLTLKWPNDL